MCSCEGNRESKLAALVEEEGKVEERERGRERESSVEGSRVRRVADAEFAVHGIPTHPPLTLFPRRRIPRLFYVHSEITQAGRRCKSRCIDRK